MLAGTPPGVRLISTLHRRLLLAHPVSGEDGAPGVPSIGFEPQRTAVDPRPTREGRPRAPHEGAWRPAEATGAPVPAPTTPAYTTRPQPFGRSRRTGLSTGPPVGPRHAITARWTCRKRDHRGPTRGKIGTDQHLYRARFGLARAVVHSATLPRPPTGRRGLLPHRCACSARFPQQVPHLWKR